MANEIEWLRRNGEYTAEANGFGLRVYFDSEPIAGDPHWVWSAMRFLHPEDESDDRILYLGGGAKTRSGAQAQAVKHAASYPEAL